MANETLVNLCLFAKFAKVFHRQCFPLYGRWARHNCWTYFSQIAASCNAFIRRGGIIECTVTGNRRYNVDLVQGGLELPCKLHFGISSPSQEFCKKIEISVCFALSETNTFSLDKPTSVIEDDAMAVETSIDVLPSKTRHCVSKLNIVDTLISLFPFQI